MRNDDLHVQRPPLLPALLACPSLPNLAESCSIDRPANQQAGDQQGRGMSRVALRMLYNKLYLATLPSDQGAGLAGDVFGRNPVPAQ